MGRIAIALLVPLVLLAAHAAARADEPTAVDEVVQAAEAHQEAGRTDEAIAAWERALALDPALGTARWALARVLATRDDADSLRTAAGHLEALLAAEPSPGVQRVAVEADLVAVTVQRAEHLEGEADASARAALLRSAVERARHVLETSSNHPVVVRALACAHAVSGDEAEEATWTARFLELAKSSRVRWSEQLERWQEAVGDAASPEQRAFFASKIDGTFDRERELRVRLASIHARRGDAAGAHRRYAALLDTAAEHVAASRFDLALADLDAFDAAGEAAGTEAARRRAAALRDDARRGLDSR